MDHLTPTGGPQSVNNGSLLSTFVNVSTGLLLDRIGGGGGHEVPGGGHSQISTDTKGTPFCGEDGREGLHQWEEITNYTLVVGILIWHKFCHHLRRHKYWLVRWFFSEWTVRLSESIAVILAIIAMKRSFDCPQRSGHSHSLEKRALASRIVVDGAILSIEVGSAGITKLWKKFFGTTAPEFGVEFVQALLAQNPPAYNAVSQVT